jgi:hypothetical protein
MLDINVNKVFVIIPKLLLVKLLQFLDQDFYVNARACILDSRYENVPRACVAFVDSVVDCGG